MIIQDKITKIFCIADCALRLRAPGRMANLCGVFHVFLYNLNTNKFCTSILNLRTRENKALLPRWL